MVETVLRPDNRRRNLLKAFLALPAFALFRAGMPAARDGVVEVGGWILKRSDLA